MILVSGVAKVVADPMYAHAGNGKTGGDILVFLNSRNDLQLVSKSRAVNKMLQEIV